MSQFFAAILAVILISLLSFVGALTFALKENLLKKILIYFVSFSAGALFGDVFIHLLPEAVEESGFTLQLSLYVLSGIVISFIMEKIIHWRHCHLPYDKQHEHRFAYMNLFGDGVHNFIDGLIIGASFIASIPLGIATTTAVILHEIPQEIGDFAVLLHGGFKRTKALLFNFITALTAVAGTVLAFFIHNYVTDLNSFLIPFAAGSFLYIAGSDLIPELHKESGLGKATIQLLTFIAGIAVMMLLLTLE